MLRGSVRNIQTRLESAYPFRLAELPEYMGIL